MANHTVMTVEKHRRPLELRAAGMGTKQIAVTMGISKPTVLRWEKRPPPVAKPNRSAVERLPLPKPKPKPHVHDCRLQNFLAPGGFQRTEALKPKTGH
jgi:DNA-binding transcriptional regulator YiaG